MALLKFYLWTLKAKKFTFLKDLDLGLEILVCTFNQQSGTMRNIFSIIQCNSKIVYVGTFMRKLCRKGEGGCSMFANPICRPKQEIWHCCYLPWGGGGRGGGGCKPMPEQTGLTNTGYSSPFTPPSQYVLNHRVHVGVE